MKSKNTYIFGYGSQGRALASSLKKESFNVTIIEADSKYYTLAKEEGFDEAYLIDVTIDAQIESLHIDSNGYIVCVMEDDHLNVFLTLTLRALYPDIRIVAISSSLHMTQKLKRAGASQVIDLYQVSANRIHNILAKPVATKLLDSFVSDIYDISFREIEIPKDSFLDGKMADEIDFSSYGVLLIGLVDMELSQKFIFITSGVSHKLDHGDIIVCIGYDSDLERFEKKVLKVKDRT